MIPTSSDNKKPHKVKERKYLNQREMLRYEDFRTVGYIWRTDLANSLIIVMPQPNYSQDYVTLRNSCSSIKKIAPRMKV